MDNLRQWFYRNHDRITWFVNGYLTFRGIQQLNHENFSGAAITFAIIALNVFLSKR
jgi:hypothetical protein